MKLARWLCVTCTLALCMYSYRIGSMSTAVSIGVGLWIPIRQTGRDGSVSPPTVSLAVRL